MFGGDIFKQFGMDAPANPGTGIYSNKKGRPESGRRGGAGGDVIPKGYRAGQIQNFTPEQMQQFSQLFSLLGEDSDLFKMAMGDQSYFDEMEAPAMRQFNELQGGLASRFSGMGMGGRKSSGFQNTSSAAASNFAQDLQSNRQNLSRQALRDLMEMSHSLMNEKPYERILSGKRQKEPGFWQQAASGASQQLGKTAGKFAFGSGDIGDASKAAGSFGIG